MGDRGIPQCVRFCPTDNELIRIFLEPKSNQVPIERCLIEHIDLYDKHPDLLPHKPSKYFPAREYWYFVTKTFKGPSKRIKRTVGTGSRNGRWVHGKTIALKEEGQTIGEKQKLFFKDKQKRHTGWHQYEYRLPSPQLLDVVSHIFYKAEDDVTLANLFDESDPLMGTLGNAQDQAGMDIDVVQPLMGNLGEAQGQTVMNIDAPILEGNFGEISQEVRNLEAEVMEEPEETADSENMLQEIMSHFQELVSVDNMDMGNFGITQNQEGINIEVMGQDQTVMNVDDQTLVGNFGETQSQEVRNFIAEFMEVPEENADSENMLQEVMNHFQELVSVDNMEIDAA